MSKPQLTQHRDHWTLTYHLIRGYSITAYIKHDYSEDPRRCRISYKYGDAIGQQWCILTTEEMQARIKVWRQHESEEEVQRLIDKSESEVMFWHQIPFLGVENVQQLTEDTWNAINLLVNPSVAS